MKVQNIFQMYVPSKSHKWSCNLVLNSDMDYPSRSIVPRYFIRTTNNMLAHLALRDMSKVHVFLLGTLDYYLFLEELVIVPVWCWQPD